MPPHFVQRIVSGGWGLPVAKHGWTSVARSVNLNRPPPCSTQMLARAARRSKSRPGVGYSRRLLPASRTPRSRRRQGPFPSSRPRLVVDGLVRFLVHLVRAARVGPVRQVEARSLWIAGVRAPDKPGTARTRRVVPILWLPAPVADEVPVDDGRVADWPDLLELWLAIRQGPTTPFGPRTVETSKVRSDNRRRGSVSSPTLRVEVEVPAAEWTAMAWAIVPLRHARILRDS